MEEKTNYYCSQKFWWLSVDLEKSATQSCCSADPHKIDINWLKQNPGSIFNTPEIQQERKMMLSDIPASSCESNCWKPERNGMESRRLSMKTHKKTHVELQSTPETLHIMVGSNCNLTCVYCCKQYSTAWGNDIKANGIYLVEGTGDRFIINDKDRILSKISQKEINLTQNKKILLEEIKLICQKSKLSKIEISGGEPFLYLYLTDLVKSLPTDVEIVIVTGLGVNEKKFSKELRSLKKHHNIILSVSAENIGNNYEFVRAGNTWQRFENNLLEIQKCGVKYQFISVLSNLTLFGLADFVKYANGVGINFLICTDPSFLSINIMDDISKTSFLNNINTLPVEIHHIIKNSMGRPVNMQEQTNLKKYLNEFSKRRNFSLDIFPKTFIEWINNVV